ncbi:MAG TPA: OmpA family protein [Nitrospiraceae bacterium]|nr:OmpA family protein [Nitrospiraceae bacterium]
MLYGHVRIAVLGLVSLGLSIQGCSGTKWFGHGSDEQSRRLAEQSLRSSDRNQDGTSSDLRAGRMPDKGTGGSVGSGGAGDTGAGGAGSVDQSYPSLSLDMRPEAGVSDPEGGSLTGFSAVEGDRISGEERLSRSKMGTMLLPVGRGESPLQAELRREEAAAIAAGLHDVFYAYNRWMVQHEDMQALTDNASWLKDHPTAMLRISGHCDERGSHDYNLVLGEKRAHAAKNILVELGISPKQLSIVSYGKDRPFCREHDEACHQQNRRGHMLLKVQ